MNSDPNSDCEQCTESKLGWVHSAHTQGPGCTHTTPRLCARRALGALSWLIVRSIVAPFSRVAARTGSVTRCVTRRVVAPWSRYKICIATQIPAARTAHRVKHAATCVAALLRRIAGRWAPCHDTKAAPPP